MHPVSRTEKGSGCTQVNSAETPIRSPSAHVDLFCRVSGGSAGHQTDALPVLSRQVGGYVRQELHADDFVAVPHLRQIVDACQPQAGVPMVIRPATYNSYEFVVIAALRAKQLLSGCVPLVPGDHSAATTAQMEVAAGRVVRTAVDLSNSPRQCLWQL